VSAKIIPDGSYIWWALRPSTRYPTIELRVADACTRLDDALAIVALFRCLVRALDRDPARNAGFDRVARAITAENKWHAQRRGMTATLVEPLRRSAISARDWLAEITAMLADDASALGCESEIAHLETIARDGTSADRQVEVYQKSLDAGATRLIALRKVVDWVARETRAGAR
jgi:carboxylate-amine ligase